MAIKRPQALRTGLFIKYFGVCCLCVLTSTVVLGIALLEVASAFLVRSRYDMMGRFVRQAAGVTAVNYIANNMAYVDMNVISITYSVVSSTINSHVFLADLSGQVIYHTNAGAEIGRAHV